MEVGAKPDWTRRDWDRCGPRCIAWQSAPPAKSQARCAASPGTIHSHASGPVARPNAASIRFSPSWARRRGTDATARNGGNGTKNSGNSCLSLAPQRMAPNSCFGDATRAWNDIMGIDLFDQHGRGFGDFCRARARGRRSGEKIRDDGARVEFRRDPHDIEMAFHTEGDMETDPSLRIVLQFLQRRDLEREPPFSTAQKNLQGGYRR